MAETNAKNLFKRQIQNRNFLSPLGYKFVLTRAPKTSFFANSASNTWDTTRCNGTT